MPQAARYDIRQSATAAASDPVAAIASSRGMSRPSITASVPPSSLHVSAGTKRIMYVAAYFARSRDRLSLCLSPSGIVPEHALRYIFIRGAPTMNSLGAAASQAMHLITGGDPTLVAIVLLSLQVSLTAVVIACAVG